MFKYAIRWLCAIALVFSAGTARATFHLFQLNEIYSNADGTVQFIELKTAAGGQQFLAGQTITSLQAQPGSYGASASYSFTFPSDLPGDTAGRTFLIGTTGFAALSVVTPDYIVPNGFLFTTNGSVNYAGVDSVSWSALPVDGVKSINRSGVTATNSPTNFAGTTASVRASSGGQASASGGVLATFATRGTVTPTAPMYGGFTIVNSSVLYIAVRGPSLKTLGFTQNPLDLPNVRLYDTSGNDILGVIVSGCPSTGTSASVAVSNYYANRGGALDVRDTCVPVSLAAGAYAFTIAPNTSSASGEMLFEVTVNP
jgi:hypothetical protein